RQHPALRGLRRSRTPKGEEPLLVVVVPLVPGVSGPGTSNKSGGDLLGPDALSFCKFGTRSQLCGYFPPASCRSVRNPRPSRSLPCCLAGAGIYHAVGDGGYTPGLGIKQAGAGGRRHTTADARHGSLSRHRSRSVATLLADTARGCL